MRSGNCEILPLDSTFAAIKFPCFSTLTILLSTRTSMPSSLRKLAIACEILVLPRDQAWSEKNRTAAAVACGKELQEQCSGVPVKANNMLECLQKAQVSARCAALAHRVLCACVIETQCNVAKASLRVKATFLDV
jgi:hypothetical protein